MASPRWHPLPASARRRTWLRVAIGALVVARGSGARPGSTCRRSSPRRPSGRRRALLGRHLAVGRVTFNPWTLELTLADLALAGAADGAPALLEARRVHADVALVSLLRLAPVIDRLEVEAPMLRVSRTGEGRYDIDDVLRAPRRRAAGRASRRASPSTTSSSPAALPTSSTGRSRRRIASATWSWRSPSSARCRRSARSRSSRTSPSRSTAATSIRPARRRRSPSAATASCTSGSTASPWRPTSATCRAACRRSCARRR